MRAGQKTAGGKMRYLFLFLVFAVISLSLATLHPKESEWEMAGKIPLILPLSKIQPMMSNISRPLVSRDFWISARGAKRLPLLLSQIKSGRVKKNLRAVKDNKGASPLHYAVRYGSSPDVLPLLLEAGADPLAGDNEGASPLHYVSLGKDQVCQFAQELIKHYEDVNLKDTSRGAAPLIWAAYNKAPLCLLKLLLEKGADPNSRTAKSLTPLMAASIFNPKAGYQKDDPYINPKAISLLLASKADISLKNTEGKTALDYMAASHAFRKTPLFKRLSSE